VKDHILWGTMLLVLTICGPGKIAVDTWFERATKAEGAIAKAPPTLQPHGARMGSIQDPFDNVWYIASQVQTAGE
jgi:uncharacterized glyoxalase superfamily protein PhnB